MILSRLIRQRRIQPSGLLINSLNSNPSPSSIISSIHTHTPIHSNQQPVKQQQQPATSKFDTAAALRDIEARGSRVRQPHSNKVPRNELGFPSQVISSELVPAELANKEIYALAPAQGCRQIVLNRPKAFNALNLNMIRLLNNILDAIKADNDVYLVCMSGSPSIRTDKVTGETKKTPLFCAGGDVVSLYNAGWKYAESNSPRPADDITRIFFREEYALDFRISHQRYPFLPILNGITMGGGVGLSVHSRYRVATDNSVFAMPECDIGFIPDVGTSYMLPRLSGSLGMFLGLTGHKLTGYDLVHAGIATHYIADELTIESLAYAMRTVGIHSRQGEDIAEQVFSLLDQPETIPPYSLEQHLDWIDHCFGAGSVGEIMARLKKTSTNTEFNTEQKTLAKQSLQAMEKASPLALHVTHHMLTESINLNLQQCFALEYRIVQRFMDGIISKDFYTGVKHKLIDKNTKQIPNWTHKSVADVTKEEVNKFFELLPEGEELEIDYPKYKEPQWYR